MTPAMHVVACGWMLDAEPSGARSRLFGLLRSAAPLLEPGELVTVLHGAGVEPIDLGERVRWQTIDVPATPTLRRVRRERAVLPAALAALEPITTIEWGTLPVPPLRACESPISLTIHDVRDLDGWRRHRAPRAVLRAVIQRSAKRATRIVVPSRFTASRLHANGITHGDIRVIPGGVDHRTTERRVDPQDPFVLHVGHLEERKNLGVLIEALHHLDTNVRLRLVGADHGARRALKALATSRGVLDRVDFTDTVDDVELERLYASAGVVAIPSLYEGFGLPALESIAHGAPTLVSDRGSLPEVVGAAGEIVPAENARAWSVAIERAISGRLPGDPERRRRVQELSWRNAAGSLVESWRDLASRKVSSVDSADRAN